MASLEHPRIVQLVGVRLSLELAQGSLTCVHSWNSFTKRSTRWSLALTK